MRQLAESGIETREGFLPYNMQEIFIQRGWTRADECPVANDVAHRGFYLPSGPGLSEEDLDYVATALIEVLSST
jgi:perosamine synthetase